MAYLMHNVNAHVIPVPLNNLFTMHLTSLLNTPARFDSGVLKKEENAWNRSALILERSSPSLSCLDLACFRGLRCRVIFCLAAFVAETNRRPTAALAATKIFLSSICLFFPLSFLYCSSPVLSFLPRQPVFFVSFSVRSGAGPFALWLVFPRLVSSAVLFRSPLRPFPLFVRPDIPAPIARDSTCRPCAKFSPWSLFLVSFDLGMFEGVSFCVCF